MGRGHRRDVSHPPPDGEQGWPRSGARLSPAGQRQGGEPPRPCPGAEGRLCRQPHPGVAAAVWWGGGSPPTEGHSVRSASLTSTLAFPHVTSVLHPRWPSPGHRLPTVPRRRSGQAGPGRGWAGRRARCACEPRASRDARPAAAPSPLLLLDATITARRRPQQNPTGTSVFSPWPGAAPGPQHTRPSVTSRAPARLRLGLKPQAGAAGVGVAGAVTLLPPLGGPCP